MRIIGAGLLFLFLAFPLLADDKPKEDPAPSKLAEQVAELGKDFQKDAIELRKAFEKADTEEEKKAVYGKYKKLQHGMAKKIMEKVEALPKDPAVGEILMTVMQLALTEPEGQKALDLLVADNPDNPKLGSICIALSRTPESEKPLRTIYGKTKNDAVKFQAAYALSQVLNKEEATPEQQQEAEKFLLEVKDNDKLGPLCMALSRTPEGEKPLRIIYGKTKNDAVKLQAAFALSHVLNKDDSSTEQRQEAEKFLLEVKEKSKDEEMVTQADKGLFEIRHLAVGKAAPNTESSTLDGKKVTIADYKGKVVVLDFWATWCGPCRGMIPHERELVKKNKDKPFVFISVSADDDKETVKKFLEDQEMPWVHWWSGREGIVEKWNVSAFPTLYIIDAKGVIRSKIVGGGPVAEKKIAELVAKLLKEADGKSE